MCVVLRLVAATVAAAVAAVVMVTAGGWTLASTLAASPAQEHFYDKYVFTKVMEQCLGSVTYYHYLAQLTAATRDCATRPTSPLLHTQVSSSRPVLPFPRPRPPPQSRPRPPPQSHSRPHSRPRPRPRPRPEAVRPFATYDWGDGGKLNFVYNRFTDNNNDNNNVNNNNINNNNNNNNNVDDVYEDNIAAEQRSYQAFDSRARPQLPLWDAGTVAAAARRYNALMSNLTCVLDAINAVDVQLRVKSDSFINYYSSLPLDAALARDLVEGVHYCHSMTRCLEPGRLRLPLPANLHTTLAFLRCERRTRLSACLKHDLRTHLRHFDVRGLPSDGGRTDAVDKLMAILVGSESSHDLDLY